MSWLNNFRIAAKIGCIIVLMTVVIIATNGLAVLRMRDMDHTSTDIITRIDKSATVMARASRRAENYISSAFQLLEEMTEAGNERLVNQAAQSQHAYKASMSDVLGRVPEKSDAISVAIGNFDRVFALCDPVIAEAARSTTAEGNQKASQRLKNECLPVAENAIAVQAKLVDDFMEEASDASNRLMEENGSSITAVVIGSIIGLLLGLAVAMLIGTRGLSQPIARLKSVMESFANNDLDPDVPGTGRQDELGDMARTVEIFKTNALEVQKLRDAQVEAEKLAAARRKSDMNRLATEFEDAVGEIVGTLSSASTELEASANTLASTAGRTQELTTSVATASGQASGNVQSVAAATEEMSSSVGEIGRQVQEAAQIAQAAVSQAQKTNERVSNLAEAASRIGDVVELINTIAGQTNLLALNATIEAARAGEAGRGFAVVATEVKALAEQTAKATGEISQQIDGIQDATQASVAAIKEIGATINRMSEISSTIASAVEEQGAATNEISRNVQQAALGTAEVSTNIVDVQRGAAETGAASSQVLAAAEALSRDSTRLKVELGRFLNTVRAA